MSGLVGRDHCSEYLAGFLPNLILSEQKGAFKNDETYLKNKKEASVIIILSEHIKRMSDLFQTEQEMLINV